MEGKPKHIIKRMLAGDQSSYDDVLAWYGDDVMRACYTLLWNEEEAKDAMQEVMLRLVQQVKKGSMRAQNGSIKGFLLKTARNYCIDRLRRRKHFYSLDDNTEYLFTPLKENRTPFMEAEDNSIQNHFEQSLSHLTDAQRTILLLHDVHDQSMQEIADSLKLTANCVKVHLHRARKCMRTQLKQWVEKS